MSNIRRGLFLLLLLIIILGIDIIIMALLNGYGGLIFCFLIVVFMILMILLLWECSYNRVKPEDIQMRNVDGNKIHIDYKDYQIECDNKYIENKTIIPKVDLNGKKVDFINRNRIQSYFLENYDDVSIPSDYIQVKKEDIMKYFDDFTLCDEEGKDDFVKKNNFPLGFVMLFVILVLLIFSNLPGVLFAIKNYKITFFIIVISIALLSYGLHTNYKIMDRQQKGSLHCKKVEIFDRRVITVGESLSYQIRVCDSSKHVLMYWFSVRRKEYDKCNSGTLYVLLNDNGNSAVYFESDELN